MNFLETDEFFTLIFNLYERNWFVVPVAILPNSTMDTRNRGFLHSVSCKEG